MTLATNSAGDLIETGTNTGRVFIKNRATNQRVDFAPDRGFVRHHWGATREDDRG